MLAEVRDDFPILKERINDQALVYFDNSATTQRPRAVIDRMSRFYVLENANVHRAVHALGERATVAYESARSNVANWIGAKSPNEIVFVRGATEGINLFAHGLSQAWQEGDEIMVTAMDHHANFVPWKRLADEKGLVLKVVPVTKEGALDLEVLVSMISDKTRLLALAHVSNVLGTINPISEITKMAHAHGVPVLVDGAQALPHQKVDMQALGCDYYVFSGHKMYGPNGIGVCYAKAELWQSMPLYQTGGEMIEHVSTDAITYKEPPYCFEAGTPNIAGAVGLSAAIDYLKEQDLSAICQHESALCAQLTEGLLQHPGVRLYGSTKHKAPVVSFAVEGYHPTDMATLLDTYGIAVRAGHHCAMPLLQVLGEPGLLRASLALYNTEEEVAYFLDKFAQVLSLLKG